MDLSFKRFEQDQSTVALAPDLAVLLGGIAARHATSPTARVEARLDRVPVAELLLAPAHGAFSLPMARLIARWREE